VDVHLPEPDFEAGPDLCTALFRVLQESLTNVARHAHASQVRISLTEADGVVRLEVHDDGKGIDPAPPGGRKSFGLLGMRERAAMLGGNVTINSNPGAGTSVLLAIPRSGEPRQTSA
jgi:signal transduction histidine kinase